MTVGTVSDRVFNTSDMLFMAAVADQVAIAIDRSRQFASEARTDHLTAPANRRQISRVTSRAVALAQGHGRRRSLIMIELVHLTRSTHLLVHCGEHRPT